MIRTVVGFLALGLFACSSASSQTIAPANFDRPFNAASKRLGTQISLVGVGCKPSECEFGAVPDLRLLVNGDSNNTKVEQVSAYLPRDVTNKARSRRSAVSATAVATTLIAVFSPKVPASKRGDAVISLLNGAAGPSRRGEVDLDGVNYVLSASQADNLRIYVTP
ncbi:hypothetical protein AB4099_05305 [Bosea sp. 2KB_26]|uniref:hypothetical protein n=1 Tax=Bosea sp. 2KB_26 TaxID=3237475 RepID=UPI003F8DA34F